MAPTKETSQLPLPVSVSRWSSFLYKIKKSLRQFRYTPFFQVLSHFLFWVNGGFIGLMFLLLQNKEEYISSGLGVLFVPGSKSNIPIFVSSSVRDLSLLPHVWLVMVAVWLFFTLVSMILHASGRYGMTSYLLAVSLLLVLLMAKVVLLPLLLIGG